MINIPLEANELIKLLQNNGHSAYVVGGCVRDSILNRKHKLNDKSYKVG